MSYRYRPLLDNGEQALRHYLEQSLREIDAAFQRLEIPQAPLLLKPPARPVEGMVVRADGVQWNPGEGRGFYGYDNGQWIKLG